MNDISILSATSATKITEMMIASIKEVKPLNRLDLDLLDENNLSKSDRKKIRKYVKLFRQIYENEIKSRNTLFKRTTRL